MELLARSGDTFEHATAPIIGASARKVWVGRALSGLAILFLAVDAAGKLLELPPVIEGTTRLGYPARAAFVIGVVLLACLVTYVIPRTAVVGAVLLTGYLGGAVASHLRVGDPLLTHTLFPIYFAVLIWGGLHLRDDRLRAAVPWRG